MSPELLVPEPTTPIGPELTDQAVLAGQEEQVLLPDTDEARKVLQLIQDYDKAEEFVRLNKTLEWRKNHHYWNSYQYLALDAMAHDWKTAEQIAEEDPEADLDPAVHAKVVNIFKAHGEIFIGALTAGVPNVRFMPSDADVHEDIVAAKARTKIAEIIQRQNRGKLQLMKALYLLYLEGMVACYNEQKSDFRFGSFKVPKMGQVPAVNRNYLCPECNQVLNSQQFSEQAAQLDDIQASTPQDCPMCGASGILPVASDFQTTTEQVVGYDKQPKNRETLEVYGPLNVKIPIWCRDRFSAPYLILETEEHVAMMRDIYPEFADRIQPTDYADVFEKEARVPSHYRGGDFPRNLCTVQRVWLRSWAFNLWRAEDAAPYKEQYPNGCYVVVINHSLVVEMLPDNLDDHWTITEHPLSEVLHAEPICKPSVHMQDITNELANLTLENIEFSLPEIFVDGNVIDTDAYGRQESRPGQLTQVTAPAGRSVSEGFFEVRGGALSQEVDKFADRIEQATQFVQGTYPSIYGGVQQGGGGTAREYELSRAAALQRLTTIWIVVQEWWARVMTKATKSFIDNMKEDAKHVQSRGNSFVNIVVRREELAGDIDEAEPEVSEAFPVSWAQKRDVILSFMQSGNEDAAVVMRHPENAGLIAEIIGVSELYIPGDDDRSKQLYEISFLIQAEPIEAPAGLLSSVPVTPELDKHEVESEICAVWLKSEAGLDARMNNPAGYANVLAHKKEHDFFVAQALEAQAQEEQEAGGDEDMSESGLSQGEQNA